MTRHDFSSWVSTNLHGLLSVSKIQEHNILQNGRLVYCCFFPFFNLKFSVSMLKSDVFDSYGDEPKLKLLILLFLDQMKL